MLCRALGICDLLPGLFQCEVDPRLEGESQLVEFSKQMVRMVSTQYQVYPLVIVP